MNRIDLSDWIVHFVHDRKAQNDPLCFNNEFNGCASSDVPDLFNEKGEPEYIFDRYLEDDYILDDNATAFEVLRKILHDGYLKSGWSFRNNKATIYGSKSAVCFTEMPLYALIDYAQSRGVYSGYVGNYAIVLNKKELFNAGARPVIYGLSTPHVEADNNDPYIKSGGCAFRLLSTEKTGIAPMEQYRYVYMNLDKNIDWTHEREWRWVLPDARYGVAGLPILLGEDYANFFSKITILVSTELEKQTILHQLKNMYDSQCTSRGFDYDVDLIKRANVISIESLKLLNTNNIRFENIPSSRMEQISEIVVSSEVLLKVKEAWSAANDIANAASKQYFEDILHSNDNDVCGYVNIQTREITEVTQAFINLGIAYSFSDGLYTLKLKNTIEVQSLNVFEAGAKAAAEYLTKMLGQNFYPVSYRD